MKKNTIFSGIQPSGNLHLGNYLGAIINWVALQEKYQGIFCVVDLHAITVPQDPDGLKKRILEIAKVCLAAGIDPKRSTLFVQSAVPAHCELMWILNTIAKTGELFKMTQFKDKAKIKDDKPNLSVDCGLLNYPILMAADILLYDTELVPVGEDQVQHVELARNLAQRFNQRFGPTFVVPQYHMHEETRRIMGLDDPTKKMSKSAPSVFNRIDLLDSPEMIRQKIKKAVTDSGAEISYAENRPALKNLLDIFSAVSGRKPQALAEEYRRGGYGKFKSDLAEAVVSFLSPFQKKYHSISDTAVKNILRSGAEKVAPLAEKKMRQVRKAVGLGI